MYLYKEKWRKVRGGEVGEAGLPILPSSDGANTWELPEVLVDPRKVTRLGGHRNPSQRAGHWVRTPAGRGYGGPHEEGRTGGGMGAAEPPYLHHAAWSGKRLPFSQREPRSEPAEKQQQ